MLCNNVDNNCVEKYVESIFNTEFKRFYLPSIQSSSFLAFIFLGYTWLEHTVWNIFLYNSTAEIFLCMSPLMYSMNFSLSNNFFITATHLLKKSPIATVS